MTRKLRGWSVMVVAAAALNAIFAHAGPDSPTQSNNTVYFQGNQSQGVFYDDLSPAMVVVTNLNSAINPGSSVIGVGMLGTNTTQNLSLTVDGSANINTTGLGAYGIELENVGGFDGTYDQVTNSFTIITNIVNGSNVVTIVTNINSGSSNVYTTVAPAGGVNLVNHGNITTSGLLAHGILAESQPGSITLTLPGFPNVSQSYGDAGAVNVVNGGNITTSQALSDGIMALSLGGLGPEDSPTSGNGLGVTVSTIGGNIFTRGAGSYGIFAQSIGGNNIGGESGGAAGDGSDGGAGGDGGLVSVTGVGTITNLSDNSGGIFALSQAGNGGNGGNGGTLGGGGGNGGPGGKGGGVFINGDWAITTFGTNSSGIVGQSLGGYGGSGGNGSPFISTGGGNGGGTGDGGAVTIISAGNIQTHGDDSLGIYARSLGGFAGSGGNSYNPFYGNAGNGNSAGAGSDVTVVNGGNITTAGNEAQAIYALSVGGGGGYGGNSGALVALGSVGGAGGNGSNVVVTNTGVLMTAGQDSHGIEAQSIGGGGGDGGNAGGLVSLGGNGSQGSEAGTVAVVNTGNITTQGSDSDGILAQSIGGGGGNAGSTAGLAALGGTGSGGGNGAAVQVFNSGNFSALGSNSYGIFAQSIGGGGGSGGGGTGLVGIGGTGGIASQSDVVNILNSGGIVSQESAIFAQSIGGGGGNGGDGGGWFAIGGYGGPGGNSGAVSVTNLGTLESVGTNASGILAQSIGGGGGNGGNATAVGAFVSLAIGGQGGAAGNGSTVRVLSGTNQFISTFGNNSYGIDAESIGGGGGNGGYAASGSVAPGFSAAISLGGDGGGGGYGSNVTVSNASGINTFGTNSHGIFAQSIGGGGGAGGFSVAITGSTGAAASMAMGGNGGTGNSGGAVGVINTGAIFTDGAHSYGLDAQSVGGGGGDGGFAISGAVSEGGSAAFSFGGSGGNGGYGSAASVFNTGAIATEGDDSHALVVQSLGGGGGTGGFSIAGSISGSGSLTASFGGTGGSGTSGGNVALINQGTISTAGQRSDGILIQSLGGGGGDGGFSVAGSFSTKPSLGLSLGGGGGAGGNAGSVVLTNNGSITTQGDDSHGIFAESLGGGGGSGGFSVAGSFAQDASLGLSIGGSGTNGGYADSVFVDNTGGVNARGNHSDGILAQSVGGGGGDGGFSVAGDVGSGNAVTVSLGGAGGAGNYGSNVTVLNTGNITTAGMQSYGIYAESLGGGGGDGGFSVSGQITKGASGASVAIGGAGGSGVNSSAVVLDNSGAVLTEGIDSHALFAESIGGGGGAGGFAGSLVANAGDGTSVSVAVGGNGGIGGNASTVNLTNSGSLATFADGADGINAQSVGGGGGDGGFGLSAVMGSGNNTARASVAVGGNGDSGGTSSNVTVINSGSIQTFGTNAQGIFAQSVGGGGGAGGFAASGAISTGTNTTQMSVSVGGTGGGGNAAGDVLVDNTSSIMTHGSNSMGIFAQSVGGSGGNGGMSFSGAISRGTSSSATLAIGGGGGIGGNGSNVDVMDLGAITTSGDNSHGVLAQSIGGGGGNGGLAAALDLTAGSPGTVYQFAVTIGGSGGAAGTGGDVQVTGSNFISTTGDDAFGVFAQSVGGGGGSGGFSLATTAVLAANQGTNRALTFAIGGGGGSGNTGGAVLVDRSGDIETTGDGSYGILAQSVGGGGGEGGGARSFSLFTRGGGAEKTNTSSKSVNISVGGSGGGASDGGAVTVNNLGSIMTSGADADGILAQSIGGGGGEGGNAHSSTDDLIPVDIPGINDLVDKAISTDADQYQVVVGGSGGSSGNGNQVNLTQTGNITTTGDGSYGIFAQSVGGGGGEAGNGGIGHESGNIGIGGGGGTAGNGNAVNVTMNGNIFTAGDGAAGIFAQSVGGGGGAAGNMDRGLKDAGLNLGLGLAFGGNGGTAGNGGLVAVTNNGNITTAGNGAYGIFVQSVGGGGGLTGDLGNDVPVLSGLTDFAGSVGGAGGGSNVTISTTGNISTYGTNSSAIFAQSAGGSNGVGGSVHVSVKGMVMANGVDADGILAQSGGGATVVTAPIPAPPLPMATTPTNQSIADTIVSEGSGIFAESLGGGGGIQPGLLSLTPDLIKPQIAPLNGDMLVLVSSNSVVQGGQGNGVGVRFLDGVNNTLQNYGMVTTVAGVNGTGVYGTDGNDFVENFGAVFGSVNLGGGANFFSNYQGALFASGNTIALGAGNSLVNDGFLMPGYTNSIVQSALTGNFTQTANGSFQVKLATNAVNDQLAVSGTASLAGNLTVTRFNGFLPQKGNEFTILTASNVSGQFASFNDPLKGNYALQLNTLYAAGSVTLQVIQDSFLQFATTGNQGAIASNLNTFSGLGTTNAGDPRGAALINFLDTQSSAELVTDLDLISPAQLGAMFDLDFASVSFSMQNLDQRLLEVRSGNHGVTGGVNSGALRGQPMQIASAGDSLPIMNAPADDAWSVFIYGGGQYISEDSTANAAGYLLRSEGVTIGMDKLLAPTVDAGVTLDYEGTHATLLNNGSVDADGGRVGGFGTWFKEGSYVEGAVGGGYNHYSTIRAALGGNATGRTDGFEVDSKVGGGHDFRWGAASFGPVGDLAFTWVHLDGFTESGSLAPLQLSVNTSDSLLSKIGGHFGWVWNTDGVAIQPDVQVAWQHESLDDDRAIDSRLASGAGNVFTVNSPAFGRDSVSLDGSFTVRWSPTVTTFLAYHGDLARQNYVAHSVNGGVNISF